MKFVYFTSYPLDRKLRNLNEAHNVTVLFLTFLLGSDGETGVLQEIKLSDSLIK